MDRKWFREEIGEIVCTLTPCDSELALANSVADPMEAHVDGLGAVELDTVIGHADSAGIVAENECRWLGVAESCSNCAEPGTGSSKHVEAGVLALGDGGYNDVKDAAVDVDGAIDVGRSVGVAKVSDAAGDSTRSRSRQVRAVRLHVEDHVACGEDELVVGVGCSVGE